jgi:hypothetical protein
MRPTSIRLFGAYGGGGGVGAGVALRKTDERGDDSKDAQNGHHSRWHPVKLSNEFRQELRSKRKRDDAPKKQTGLRPIAQQ